MLRWIALPAAALFRPAADAKEKPARQTGGLEGLRDRLLWRTEEGGNHRVIITEDACSVS